MGGVLGRLPDQPRERDQGRRGEHEEQDLAGPREAVDEHGDGAEDEESDEDLADHGGGAAY